MQESNQTFQAYASVLEQSQNPSKQVRQQAEAQIKQMMSTAGFGTIALKFLTLDNVPPALKQSSAVLFKNLIKDHYDSVNDQDKAQIKSVILPFLLSGPPANLRSLLSASVTLLAQHDFPAMWPNLVKDLVSRANPNDYNTLVGVLRTAHSVFRRYRNVSMSPEVLKELKFILNEFQQPLLSIYLKTWSMVEGAANDASRLPVLIETLNLCTKLFYDLNYVDLPEFFEDHMKEWMTGFLQALRFKSNMVQVLGDDEDKPGKLHKLQKNVCLALTLYSTKYDEEFAPYLEGFVQSVWQLLTDCLAATQAAAKFGPIVAHGVAFLTAVANGAHHKIFGNGDILKQICEKIVIPCMMLTEDDVELFEDDPIEYVRRDIEGSDLDTRRRAAKELVKGLRKNYEKPVTEIFGSYIQILLKQYQSNPQGNWRAKDVAVYLLTAVAVSTFRQATGASSVNPMVPLVPFYKENVVCDLSASAHLHPMLQADALKFVITFRSQIPPSEYGQLLPAILGQLKSPAWVIHTYAANALDSMLTIKDNGVPRINKDNLAPMLKDSLGALFGVFEKTRQRPNSYVMRCIMRVIAKGSSKMGPLIPMTLNGLSGVLQSIILNQQSPLFNHYLFESLGALISAAAAAGGEGSVSQLEAAMLPMFQSILTQEIQEFTGYVFQILAQLLHEHKQVPDVFWSLFPSLLSPSLWDKAGNVPALVRLLNGYLARGAAKIAGNQQWLMSILGVWQHLNSTAKHDGQTFDLLRGLTDHMPLQVLDNFLERILGYIFARLSAPKGKTPRYVKGFSTWLCSFAAGHGGAAIIARCNKVQPSIWTNCVNLIGQSINQPRTGGDKKRCAMGAVKLLTATDEMLADPYVSLWGPLLLALMGLFELPEDDEPEGPEDEEISGGAVFSPLFYSGMLSDPDPHPGVDARVELAKGLAQLNQKSGGKAMGMVTSALPAEAQQKLQGYFKNAGVSL